MTSPAVRPFYIDVPEEDLDDLHRRIAAASSVSPEGDGGARRR